MWDHETIMMIVQGVGETLYMTVLSTVLGYLFGLPMGVLLAVSDKEGLKPNAVLYKILDAIANIVRSIPFLILLILLIPFTRAVVGKSYGSTATVVPLVVAAIPFIARMVESSIKEVDAGVIEAARAMGASNIRIIMKVLLVEARTSLITGATIAIGTILGYSAMSGAVGGGGLGDIAIRYGYYMRTVAHTAEAGTEASHAISETAGPTLTVTAETKLSFPDAVVPSALKSSMSG